MTLNLLDLEEKLMQCHNCHLNRNVIYKFRMIH